MEKTLKELAEYVGGMVVGDPTVKIIGVMSIDDAQEGHITFISNEKYIKKIHHTKASAIIVSPKLKTAKGNLLVCNNPYLAFAKLVELLMYKKPAYIKGIDDSARIAKTAIIGKDISICAYVTIGENARIGNRVVLQPCVYIGNNCTIGANTTINRAVLGETIIRKGTKIDSQVVISHNVEVGENSLIVSQVGIAGSAKIGKHVTIAGGAGIVGHIQIGDNITVGGYSGVINDIPSNETYLGAPALPIKRMRKCYVIIERLPEMREHIKTLEKRIEQLEKRDSAPQNTQSQKKNGS